MPPAQGQLGDVYKWEAKFGELDVTEAKRNRSLAEENAKLKKLLTNAMLDALDRNRPPSRARRSDVRPTSRLHHGEAF